MAQALDLRGEDVRGYVDYLRDLGVFDLYSVDPPTDEEALLAWYASLDASAGLPKRVPATSPERSSAPTPHSPASTSMSPFERSAQRSAVPPRPLGAGGLRPAGPQITITPAPAASLAPLPTAEPQLEDLAAQDMVSEMAPVSFNQLAPLPSVRVPATGRPAALQALREEIGDCTRCPLAYAGRHKIVFGEGMATARLLFVGEGPGADEDESGIPFVGKAGQLLNNMIAAMGLTRESVYIANVVKCRPPKNRTPEPVEAGTCSQFLLRQIDIVQPEVIVALGATAATYLLGVKQSLASLRGRWFDVRGAPCAVTYHPAYLLRDPRQKGEAWKDLQRVMVEMKLTPPVRG